MIKRERREETREMSRWKRMNERLISEMDDEKNSVKDNDARGEQESGKEKEEGDDDVEEDEKRKEVKCARLVTRSMK